MILYDQRAAERFGFDARIRIVCAADPQGDSAFRDRHVQQAYENARIAFHFAALVIAWGERHQSGPISVGLNAYQQLVEPFQ